jgi:[protein-PII] uridylyltransferase
MNAGMLRDALEKAWTRPESERREALAALLKTAQVGLRDDMNRRLEKEKNAGLEAMYAHAAGMDALLSDVAAFACETVFPAETSEAPVLAAVGGYGRGELAPFSDIDLLFLLPEGGDGRLAEIVSFILYLLWDSGLKVGHAVRTPAESVRQARQDMSIRTNLLEARFIWGNESLFRDFAERYEKLKRETDPREFVEAKRAERAERCLRLGQSRYMLEPNVKESRGGLRDLHLLFWLAKYLFGVTDMRDLAARDIISPKNVALFLKAHRFLSTVRCRLHLHEGRPGDILTFDAQKEIAARMGYTDRTSAAAVERFMKHYYLVSKNVGELSFLITAAIEDNLNGPARIEEVSGFPEFRRINGRLDFRDAADIERDPLLLLRIFALRQSAGLKIGPAALQTVAEKAKEIRRVRKTPDAQELFFGILLSDEAESALRRMSETGLLSYFLPPWQNIVAQMQFDLYHVYTTDEHTLKTVGFLHHAEPEGVQSRRALYAAALLHDIAKGRGGGHAEKGAVLTFKTAPALGLDEEETETTAWLVGNHLLMSQTAFRRDIFDPKTIEDFVAAVQSPERLRLLYALTKADIMAVGPAVWNGFKEKLLNDLFDIALEKMQGSVRPRPLSPAQEKLAARPPSDDFSFAVQTDAARGATEFIVLAPDRDGLFAEITGAMALVGVSVAEAQIMTLPNGMALDTFLIQETDMLDAEIRRPVASEKKIRRLQETVRRARETDIAGELRKKRLTARPSAMWFPPRVFIDNNASQTSTLIEINGNDAVGFLHAVTHAMTDLELNIVSAHVYTYGSHVVDVFYVTDRKGRKITDAETAARIKSVLLDTLNGNASFSG